MAKCLNQTMNVGHECLGEDGVVSSIWAVEDSFYPVWHAQRRPQFDYILHQVRNPIPTIGSLTTANWSSWEWNARHIELDLNQPINLIAAQYWLNWNKLCESISEMTYRIEDINCSVNRRLNHREHIQLCWSDLGKYENDIKELARGYGYEVN
jgi:hypothetical protein